MHMSLDTLPLIARKAQHMADLEVSVMLLLKLLHLLFQSYIYELGIVFSDIFFSDEQREQPVIPDVVIRVIARKLCTNSSTDSDSF